ncbi:hypothetical protein [Streptomyces sp. NPDC046805]|uniref:hypothetical protein n=1 Tax=Streptomyces sp. NPDC046805 TaxID=3155134 RepID=UPI0033D2919C
MITHYRPWPDGTVRIVDRPMTPSQRDYVVGEGVERFRKLSSFRDVDLRAHGVDTVTRDGRPLRVDWLAEDGVAYAWFEEL